MNELVVAVKELSKISKLDYINDIFQILSNVVVIFTFIWAIYEFIRRNRRARAEKAIELANDFEKEIIPMINSMSWLFTFLPFYNKLDKMDIDEIAFFDTEEMENLFEKEEITSCIDFCRALEVGKYKVEKIKNEEGKEIKRLQLLNESCEKCGKEIQVTSLLNKLEAFSMAFNHKVADESVIYQSIHQLYFSTIKTLYIRIAYCNKYEKDKYYTNIIKLFNEWKKRYDNVMKMDMKRKEKMMKFKKV